MIPFALLLLAAALLYFAYDLRRLAAEKSAETGVRGSVLYSDADHERPVENLTCRIDETLTLVGKPDYILKQEGKIIPFEYKSGRAPKKLYASYEEQVGAYFLLIESTYGKSAAPPYGIVKFADGEPFQVENTPQLRERVIRDARAMAAIQRETAEAHRQHKIPAMCSSCRFFPVCDERLL